jgi:hypothetical protein
VFVCIYIYRNITQPQRKIEIVLFAGKLMELEIIMLQEISEAKKVKYYTFSLVCGT